MLTGANWLKIITRCTERACTDQLVVMIDVGGRIKNEEDYTSSSSSWLLFWRFDRQYWTGSSVCQLFNYPTAPAASSSFAGFYKQMHMMNYLNLNDLGFLLIMSSSSIAFVYPRCLLGGSCFIISPPHTSDDLLLHWMIECCCYDVRPMKNLLLLSNRSWNWCKDDHQEFSVQKFTSCSSDKSTKRARLFEQCSNGNSGRGQEEHPRMKQSTMVLSEHHRRL